MAREVRGAAVELWVPRRPGAAETLTRRHSGVTLRWQSGTDLGARLGAAFQAAFSDGVDHAIVIGSDHPTLTAACLERGFRALRSAELVLGPTPDGGYYAVGLRRGAWPRAAALFRDVPWSTPRVLALTRERSEGLDLCRAELPECHDVDEPDDLDRLRREVASGTATAAALEDLDRRGRGGG